MELPDCEMSAQDWAKPVGAGLAASLDMPYPGGVWAGQQERRQERAVP
jgi:hypothetical protein